MEPEVISALIAVPMAAVTVVASTGVAVYAARKQARAVVEAARAGAHATRTAGIEQAFAQADSTYALERRSERRAACEDVFTAALDHLDNARRVLMSVRMHHADAGCLAASAIRRRLEGSDEAEPADNALPDPPLELPSLKGLRRAIARLTIIGGTDEVLRAAGELRRSCTESDHQVRLLRDHAVRIYREDGRVTEDGQILLPMDPEDPEFGGLLLPNPDEEREATEEALRQTSVRLNTFASSARAYADTVLFAQRPGGERMSR